MMKKKHQNGDETVREMFFNGDMIDNYKGDARLTYLWKDDQDRAAWLNYDYAITWQFKKDGSYATGWLSSNTPVINLYTPYLYRKIDLMGDKDKLRKLGVVAVAVEIEYPFFGRVKKERVTVKTNSGGEEPTLEAILPQGVDRVDYKVTWLYLEGKKVERRGEDEFGVILIDEIPEG
jgi:hypothetical protein